MIVPMLCGKGEREQCQKSLSRSPLHRVRGDKTVTSASFFGIEAELAEGVSSYTTHPAIHASMM
jgi:hypothetical protein